MTYAFLGDTSPTNRVGDSSDTWCPSPENQHDKGKSVCFFRGYIFIRGCNPLYLDLFKVFLLRIVDD